MDLSFTPEEEAFAQDVREWLAADVRGPDRFETIADEVEFGRAWQARLAAAAGSASTGRRSTAAAGPRR